MSKEVKTTVSEFGIVKKIMAILKLDEAGKISKFFTQEVKAANTAIKQIEANKKMKAMQFEIDEEKLEADIEDAEGRVEAALENITLENVKDNATMQEFASIYWARVKKADNELESLKESLKNLKERNKEDIEVDNKLIASYQSRIDRIKK